MSEPPVPTGTIRLTGVRGAIVRVLARMNAAGLAATSGYLNDAINRVLSLSPFTPLSSITGQPAMSLPLQWTADGLPIGAHFVGRFGDEATLFKLAAQLEQAQPWFDKTPLVRA
jgi:amidase